MNQRTWTSTMTIAMLLILGGCDSGSDDSSMGTGGMMMNSGGTHCTELCDLSAMLACPNHNASTCVTDCEKTAVAFPTCIAEMQDLYDCAYLQPVANWECDASTGEATVKAAFCGAERTAAEDCAISAASGN